MPSANAVMLKSPKGIVKAYDPEQYDIPGMLKGGFTRSPGVMVAAHMRQFPAATAPAQSTPLGDVSPTTISGRQDNAVPQGLDAPAGGSLPATPSGQWDWGRFTGDVQTPERGTPGAPVEPGLLHNSPLIASLVGAVGGPAGAMGLGAGTEAVRQLIDRGEGYPVPQTPLGASNAITTEAARQAAYGLAGLGIGKGVGMVANPIMQAALRAGGPEAQALLDYGISATKGGLSKLNGILGESGPLGGLKASFLKRMTAMGVTHDPSIIAQNAMADIADRDPGVARILSNGRLSPGAVITDVDRARAAQYEDLFRKWYGDNPSPIKPEDLEMARRRYDVAARAHYNMAAGNPSKAEIDALDPKGIFNKAMADAMREQQNLGSRGLTAIHPQTGSPTTLADVNGEMSRLAKAHDVLAPLVTPSKAGLGAQLVQRGAIPATGAAIGAALPGNRGSHALEGALAGAAFQSPLVMSMLARALASPATTGTFGQLPRMAVGGGMAAAGR